VIPPADDAAPVEQVAPAEEPAPEAAQPPAEAQPEPGEPGAEEPEGVEEITVWGRLATEQAYDAIVRQMEDLGWRVVRREDDRIVMKGPRAWMGRAELDEDGNFSWGRPLMGFTTLPDEAWTPPADEPPDPRVAQPSVGAGPTVWILPSRRKLDLVRTAVVDATADEVQEYREVRARTLFEEQLQALPDRLDALWTQGTPLEGGGEPLPDPDARRRAVLAYWASRADTPEGRRAAAVIETWLAETVQTSPHPITAQERATYVRTDGRALP
jgi:hypothetical protein